MRLDLGQSFLYQPDGVSDVFLAKAPRTLLLFLSAAVLSYLLGIWLGKLAAWKRGGWVEASAVLSGVAAHTTFAPWLAFLGLNVFAWHLRWLPYQNFINFNIWLGSGATADSVFFQMVLTALAVAALLIGGRALARRIEPPIEHLRSAIGVVGAAILAVAWWASGRVPLALDISEHLLLPLGTVVLLSFGETMMTMRAAMLETQSDDHVIAARAKGISDNLVRDRHVARLAMMPVLTRMLLTLPFVLVGSLVIERVFFWRAMGDVVFNAVEWQDLPLILGVLTVVGVLTLVAHVVLDVAYVALDPRLRNV